MSLRTLLLERLKLQSDAQFEEIYSASKPSILGCEAKSARQFPLTNERCSSFDF